MSRTIAVVTGFEAIPEQARCRCGADLHLSSFLQRRPDGRAFLTCLACGDLVADVVADIATTDEDENIT